MSRHLPTLLVTVALTLAAAACTRGEAAPPLAAAPAAAAPAAAGALPRLVFFENPNGRPCQMQDEVLNGMAAELGGKVEVVRYKTTERADLAKFQAFGIRSLPMLVLTDAAGNELRRATPGVQPADAVRRLITR